MDPLKSKGVLQARKSFVFSRVDDHGFEDFEYVFPEFPRECNVWWIDSLEVEHVSGKELSWIELNELGTNNNRFMLVEGVSLGSFYPVIETSELTGVQNIRFYGTPLRKITICIKYGCYV